MTVETSYAELDFDEASVEVRIITAHDKCLEVENLKLLVAREKPPSHMFCYSLKGIETNNNLAIIDDAYSRIKSSKILLDTAAEFHRSFLLPQTTCQPPKMYQQWVSQKGRIA